MSHSQPGTVIPDPAGPMAGSILFGERRPHGAGCDVFVGRQPIYDRRSNLFAYELLFRRGDVAQANVVDGDEATFTVMLNSLVEIGLTNLVGSAHAFLNVTRNSVLCEYPNFFPKDQVVLEVLESVHVDDEFVAMLRGFKDAGYTIALDDFVFHERWKPLLELADIIKLDVQSLAPDQLRQHVDQFGRFQLLAEKIETREQFETCRDLGFTYFQGYFLCKPKVVTVRHVPTSQLATLRLLAKIHEPDVEPEDVINIVGQDVALSYRLIRTVNSAEYALREKIETIGQAVRHLGLPRIRSWVTLLSISGVDDSPLELMSTSMVRARMCELLAPDPSPAGRAKAFLVGLFSVLDALMGAPMEDLLEALPLAADVEDALRESKGELGVLLRCVLAYEFSDWANVTLPGHDRAAITDAYLRAIAWAGEARLAMGF